MERRQFLKVAGAGAAAVVAAAALPPVVELILSGNERRLRFTATAGVPRAPLPVYATYVLKGEIDLDRRTGAITSDLLAGSSGSSSALSIPGLSRAISVSAVREDQGIIEVTGVTDGQPHLLAGEDANIRLILDRPHGVAEASFFGHPLTMQLVERTK
jgi:hypothetical protein